jgi:hypothetical protein
VVEVWDTSRPRQYDRINAHTAKKLTYFSHSLMTFVQNLKYNVWQKHLITDHMLPRLRGIYLC